MASSDVADLIKLVWTVFKVCAFIAGLIALPFAIAAHRERRREQAAAMTAKARELGFEFSQTANSRLAGLVRHLDSLDVNNGRDRYAFNVVEGSLDGHPVAVFDYHYATRGDCPELTIGPEGGGLFKMIAETFGGGDIDFESHEFSERFDVRSKNKKFAYDFCNARMIEYLLDHRGISLEVDSSSLAMGYEDMHDISRIKRRLASLVEIRSRMPNYLFEGANA
jgi:hypothetical protein